MNNYSFKKELNRKTQMAEVYNHLFKLAKDRNDAKYFIPESFDDKITFDDITVVIIKKTKRRLVIALLDNRNHKNASKSASGIALVFTEIFFSVRGLEDCGDYVCLDLDLAHFDLDIDYDERLPFKEFVQKYGERVLEQK